MPCEFGAFCVLFQDCIWSWRSHNFLIITMNPDCYIWPFSDSSLSMHKKNKNQSICEQWFAPCWSGLQFLDHYWSTNSIMWTSLVSEERVDLFFLIGKKKKRKKKKESTWISSFTSRYSWFINLFLLKLWSRIYYTSDLFFLLFRIYGCLLTIYFELVITVDAVNLFSTEKMLNIEKKYIVDGNILS